jgi:hypothetical protein
MHLGALLLDEAPRGPEVDGQGRIPQPHRRAEEQARQSPPNQSSLRRISIRTSCIA